MDSTAVTPQQVVSRKEINCEIVLVNDKEHTYVDCVHFIAALSKIWKERDQVNQRSGIITNTLPYVGNLHVSGHVAEFEGPWRRHHCR